MSEVNKNIDISVDRVCVYISKFYFTAKAINHER
jgi:hypothetical protein